MPGKKESPSRRALLTQGLRTLAVAGVAGQVLSAAGSGNRILVCIYLTGGNDGNNLIVPLDGSQYPAYARMRGALALDSSELLSVRSVATPGEYGFHPALGEIRDLYNRGVLGVVANVGSLPPASPPVGHDYSSMAFLKGGYMTQGFAAAKAGLKISETDSVLTTNRGVSMIPLEGSASIGDHRRITQAANSVEIHTQFPATSLGHALQEVAGLIHGARSNGLRRNLFTVTMGGFDTHGSQLATQATLFRELSGAMAAFYAANEELGTAGDVTVFTDSEFGRSLTPNANNGTGHGWGNHQLVMGRSVLGGEIYGAFPDMATGARVAGGGWVPTTSRDRYLATFAGWIGFSYSDLTRSFPQLNGASGLGFLA